MHSVPTFPSDTMTVIAWPDDVIDQVGHDARSRYVETFWLGVLGPSATWLLRRIADELEANPNGFTMDLEEMAQGIGVRGVARNSPFVRALGRLCQFELAQLQAPNLLAVHRYIPSLSRRHIVRLSTQLKAEHADWQKRQLSSAS